MKAWSRRGLVAAIVAGMLVWISFPILVFYWASARASETPLRQESSVWVAPTPAGPTLESTIGVAVEWGQGPSLRAPSWTGLLQRVDITEGQKIEHGMPVVLVDGIVRQAWQTALPFARFISSGDSGADVTALKAALAKLGYAVTEGDRLDWRTLLAVRGFASSIGVPGSRDLTAFDPGWVIFLPEPITAGQILLTVGTLAPATGDELVTGRERVSDAVFTSAAIVEQLEASDVAIEIDRDVPVASRVAVDSDEFLTIAESRLTPSTSDATRPDSISLETLSLLLRPQTTGTTARLSSPAPTGSWILPAAAIYIASSGKTCLLVKDNDEPRAMPVEVLSESDGSAVVAAPLSVNLVAALYPSEDVGCE